MATTGAIALRVLVASLCLVANAPSFARNLVVNGGFEQPVVPVASPQLFATGTGVAGWTVVGETGNVALLNGDFIQFGLKFTPQHGVQSLDLTGLSSTRTGVTQAVPTVAGAAYVLTFHIGNVQAPDTTPWGNASSVQALLDGVPLATATHRDGPTGELGWREFSYPFTAAAASSRVTFINLDRPTDHVNQLDNVRIVATATATGTHADITPAGVTSGGNPGWAVIAGLLFAAVVVMCAYALVRRRRRRRG